MRFLFLLPLLGLASCTLEPGENGLELIPRVPYESSLREVGSPLVWSGEPIELSVELGNVELIGDPDASELSVRARALTWSRLNDQESARAANNAILATAQVVVQNGRVRVSCGRLAEDIGSALANATQCDVRVVVPASAGVTHAVRVETGNGAAFLQRLTSPPGGRIEAEIAGRLEAWELRGDLLLRAGSMDVEVSPTAGSVVDAEASVIWSGGTPSEEEQKQEAGVTLRLPADFRSQMVHLGSAQGSVVTADFPGLQPGQPWKAGPGAAQFLRVQADWGDATLRPLVGVVPGRYRESPLGRSETKP